MTTREGAVRIDPMRLPFIRVVIRVHPRPNLLLDFDSIARGPAA
jgi:hypothetical protein